jgi:ubiquinone biosynthesis protein UbiJ
MDILTPYIIWNTFITLVLAPLMYSIRQNAAELKRQDILINKTREEVAKEYVTKSEVKDDMNNLIDRLEKLDEKIDRLFEIK